MAKSKWKDIEGLIICPDSSFLVAYLDESEENHNLAESAMGFLAPHQHNIIISQFVYAETLSTLTKKMPVGEAIKRLKKINKIKGAKLWRGSPNYDDIEEFYKQNARKRILKELRTNDFVIVAYAMMWNALILTNDIKMFEETKRTYKDIFFLSQDSRIDNNFDKFSKRVLYKLKK